MSADCFATIITSALLDECPRAAIKSEQSPRVDVAVSHRLLRLMERPSNATRPWWTDDAAADWTPEWPAPSTPWPGHNHSTLSAQSEAVLAYFRLATTCVMSVIMLVGVTGNVLVPIVIAHSKDLRNSTNVFLVNLALADLLVILICLPTGFVELHSTPGAWYLGETMCKCARASSSLFRFAVAGHRRRRCVAFICSPRTTGAATKGAGRQNDERDAWRAPSAPRRRLINSTVKVSEAHAKTFTRPAPHRFDGRGHPSVTSRRFSNLAPPPQRTEYSPRARRSRGSLSG